MDVLPAKVPMTQQLSAATTSLSVPSVGTVSNAMLDKRGDPPSDEAGIVPSAKRPCHGERLETRPRAEGFDKTDETPKAASTSSQFANQQATSSSQAVRPVSAGDRTSTQAPSKDAVDLDEIPRSEPVPDMGSSSSLQKDMVQDHASVSGHTLIQGDDAADGSDPSQEEAESAELQRTSSVQPLESEHEARIRIISSLFYFGWNFTLEEKAEFENEILRRAISLSKRKKAFMEQVDKHCRVSVRQDVVGPRRCFMAAILGGAPGSPKPGDDASRSSCARRKATKILCCSFVKLAPGVVSAHGARVNDELDSDARRWKPELQLRTITLDDRDICWVFKERKQKKSDPTKQVWQGRGYNL